MTLLRALVLTLAAALAAASAAAAAPPKLAASVSDPFKISLTQGGKAVKTLKAGAYTIVVKDASTLHDFHLVGPGVNKTTSVAGKGSFTWRVTLKPGTYKFLCDAHVSFMKGSFRVK